MRWLLAVAIAAQFSLNVHAAEPTGDEAVSFVDATSTPTEVTITAIPMPERVTELLAPTNPAVKKAKLAKQKTFPKTLLSRTERHQLALLAQRNKGNGNPVRMANDEDGPAGYDELPLHQFYSRPRLVNDDDDVPEIVLLSDTARVRLLMARLKALEAHALAQVTDDGEALPEAISQRLAAARMKAVEAHQKKFA